MWQAFISSDYDDSVVWSNAAYPLAAVTAQTWATGVVVGIAGIALAIGSAVYHATYERWAQRLDMTGVMTYVSAAVAVILSQWTVWAYLLVPTAAVVYWCWTWEIDSHIHVPVWATMGLIALGVQQGVWMLVPGSFFLAAGIVKICEPGSDHWLHSLWHGLSAMVVAMMLWIL
jgi:hypothetical protein